VRYHPGRGRQTLDIFSPEGAGLRPVVFFAHGGAWTFGDKNLFGLYRGLGRYLARRGLTAVLANYRLSPGVRHPEHLRDVARAFAWTRRHVAACGGDARRIVLCGHSAGGHLVSLLAARNGSPRDPDLSLNQMDRAAIRGVIGICGVYSVPDDAQFFAMARAWLLGMRVPGMVKNALLRNADAINPFRMAFGAGDDVRRDASPITHVRSGLPPFLLLSAAKEVVGLRGMAEAFARSLGDSGNVVEWHTVAGTNHNTIPFNLGRHGDAVGPILLDFIRRHGGPAASNP
jgi:acetyl esterase/lipase